MNKHFEEVKEKGVVTGHKCKVCAANKPSKDIVIAKCKGGSTYNRTRHRDSALLTDKDKKDARRLLEKEAIEMAAAADSSEVERPSKSRKEEVITDPRYLRFELEKEQREEARKARRGQGAGGASEKDAAAESSDDDMQVDTHVAVRDEVERYFKLKITAVASPIRWWRDKRAAFPTLSRLAAKYLSVPASSASVERVFSQAGLTLTKLRTRMSTELLEELLIIKYHHFAGLKYYTVKQWAEIEKLIEEEEEEVVVVV